jgi:4-carboxymuconolactone decarboxylase
VSERDEDGRIARGRATYARLFGVDEAAAASNLTQRAGPQYAAEAMLAAGGPGWHGTNLTDRERSVAVIAALVAHHVTDQRLETYLGFARRSGITEEGLADLMALLTNYLGQPAPSVAMSVVIETDPRRRD